MTVDEILEKFKERICKITHKEIPEYDWQLARYDNAKWEAIQAVKDRVREVMQSEGEILEIIMKNCGHIEQTAQAIHTEMDKAVEKL